MGGKPLSNDDFRKLMMTPRPGSQPAMGNRTDDRTQKDKKQKQGKPFKPKPKPGDEDKDAEEQGAAYRDRAAERRKGFNTELEGVPEDMVGLLIGAQPSNLANLTVEETKYLGGDMEHTHLVKGLDYALLNKVRADNEAKPASAAPTALGGSDREDSRGGTAPGAASAATFQSRLGRNVYNTLFGPKFDQPIPAAAVSELFLPKRTAFIYELEDSSQATDVPTTLRRAKEDCPVPKKTMYASVDGAVLERLAKLMAYMSTSNGGKRKIKKKEKAEMLRMLTGQLAPSDTATPGDHPDSDQLLTNPGSGAAAALSKPVDDDEDIFGDAGTDYVPTVTAPTTTAAAAAGTSEAAKQREYFEGPSALAGTELLPPMVAGGATEGPEMGPMRPGDGPEMYPEAEDDALVLEQKAAEAKDKANKAKRMLEEADDGYAECYPSYYDYAGTVYDSDEDADKPKSLVPPEGEEATAGAAGDAAKNARREAMKTQQKEKSKEVKELQDIEKIFEEKGFEKSGAFGKKSGRGKDEGKKGEGEGMGVGVPQKKRRI